MKVVRSRHDTPFELPVAFCACILDTSEDTLSLLLIIHTSRPGSVAFLTHVLLVRPERPLVGLH